MNEKPYTKSLQDELDWKLLDQLHSVVAQISGFCFETKKFCVTTEFVVLAFLAKFTKDSLDHSLFITGLLIALCFWFLDGVAYFYQVKLRGTMGVIRDRLASRSHEPIILDVRVKVIEDERIDGAIGTRIREAFFNHSMWIYYALLLLGAIAWILFALGAIK